MPANRSLLMTGLFEYDPGQWTTFYSRNNKLRAFQGKSVSEPLFAGLSLFPLVSFKCELKRCEITRGAHNVADWPDLVSTPPVRVKGARDSETGFSCHLEIATKIATVTYSHPFDLSVSRYSCQIRYINDSCQPETIHR